MSLNEGKELPFQGTVGAPLDPLAVVSPSADIDQKDRLNGHPTVIRFGIRPPDGQQHMKVSVQRSAAQPGPARVSQRLQPLPGNRLMMSDKLVGGSVVGIQLQTRIVGVNRFRRRFRKGQVRDSKLLETRWTGVFLDGGPPRTSENRQDYYGAGKLGIITEK